MLTLEKWTDKDYERLTQYLEDNADSKYREFHSSIVPDIKNGGFIGIRMPFMRSLAKEISRGNARQFLEISKT